MQAVGRGNITPRLKVSSPGREHKGETHKENVLPAPKASSLCEQAFSVRGASGPWKGLEAHLSILILFNLLSAPNADDGQDRERRFNDRILCRCIQAASIQTQSPLPQRRGQILAQVRRCRNPRRSTAQAGAPSWVRQLAEAKGARRGLFMRSAGLSRQSTPTTGTGEAAD